jgi:branched-chain amino acid aminotransferase
MTTKGTGGGGFNASEWIWKDGEWIRWEDSRVHLLSTAVQFGTSMFEGIRCYETPEGPAIFRLHDHIRRLLDSCRIYRMLPEHDASTWVQACVDAVARNGLGSCYVRPMVLRGYFGPSLMPYNSPIESYVAAWAWGTYLGEEALEKGVDVCVSSWNRAAPNTFPVSAKAAGHYVSAQLIKMEAHENGYAEGIALGPEGRVSEGSGQNLFLVRDGVLISPELDGTSLAGITRHSVLALAEELGIPSREQPVPRESLYTADELFFTGTATEVVPIRSVDRIAVGGGKAGPITLAIQQRFMDLVQGRIEDPRGWRTLVPTG